MLATSLQASLPARICVAIIIAILAQAVQADSASHSLDLYPAAAVTSYTTLTVKYTAPAGSSTADWIAIFCVDAPNSPSLVWSYTNGNSNGTLTFTAPSARCILEARYLLDDGYDVAVTSRTKTFNNPQSTVTVDYDNGTIVDVEGVTVLSFLWMDVNQSGIDAACLGSSSMISFSGLVQSLDLVGDGLGTIYATCGTRSVMLSLPMTANHTIGSATSIQLLTECGALASVVKGPRWSDPMVYGVCTSSRLLISLNTTSNASTTIANLSSRCDFANRVVLSEANVFYTACNNGNVLKVTAAGQTSLMLNGSQCDQPSDLTVVQQLLSGDDHLFVVCGGTDGKILSVRFTTSATKPVITVMTDGTTCDNPSLVTAFQDTTGAISVFAVCDAGGGGSSVIAIVTPSNAVTELLTASDMRMANTTVTALTVLAPANGAEAPSLLLSIVDTHTTLLQVDLRCGSVGGYAVKSGVCTACEFGEYRPSGSATALCRTCQPGRVTTVRGTAQCKNCTSGQYSDNPLLCFPCGPGKYSNAQGSAECKPCELGKISNSSSTACVACPAGKISNNVDGLSCFPCGAGLVSTKNGSTVCDACKPGKFASTVESVQCTDCLKGRFSSDYGSSTCLRCAPGSVQNKTGQTGCNECVAGTIARTFGQSQCEPCPEMHYQPENGSNVCLICAPGRYSLIQGASEPCAACVPGTFCSGDGRVVVETGFFVYQKSSALESIRCLTPACVGGDIQSQCSANRLPPSQNLLCGQCLPGFSEWGGKCVECTRTNAPLILGATLFSWGLVLILYFTVRHPSNLYPGVLNITFYFIQTTVVVFGHFIPWVQGLGILNLQPTETVGSSGTCVAPLSQEEKAIVDLVEPALFPILLGLNMLLHRLICSETFLQLFCRRLPRLSAQLQGSFDSNGYCRTLLAVLLLSYTRIVTVVFKLLNCVEIGGSLIVQSSPGIFCHSDFYRNGLRPVLIILVVTVVAAFPLSMAFCFWRAGRLRATVYDDCGTKGAEQINRNHELVLRFGNLFESFRSQYWWWQVVVLLRRLATAALVAFAFSILDESQNGWRFAAVGMLHLGFLCLQIAARPSLSRVNNILEMMQLTFLSINCFLVLANPMEPISTTQVALVSTCIAIPLTVMGFMAAKVIYKHPKSIMGLIR